MHLASSRIAFSTTLRSGSHAITAPLSQHGLNSARLLRLLLNVRFAHDNTGAYRRLLAAARKQPVLPGILENDLADKAARRQSRALHWGT